MNSRCSLVGATLVATLLANCHLGSRAEMAVCKQTEAIKGTDGPVISSAKAEDQTCPIPETVWERFAKQGEIALKAGKFGDAERFYNSALKEAQKTSKQDRRLAESYENLAALYQARGQFAKSEPLMEKAMSARGKLLGVEDPEVLISLARLGQFYLAHGKTVKSERLYNKLVEFTERKFQREQKAIANLQELAAFFATRPQLEAARPLIKQAQQMTANSLNDQYPELAVGLDRLGTTYQQRNKLPQAEQLFKLALAIRERSLKSEHLALSASYENLASVLLAQAKFAQAEPLFKKSLQICEKVGGGRDLFTKIDGLAQCYTNLGDRSSAEELYLRLLANADKSGSANGPDTGKYLTALAQTYIQEGKFAQAEPLLKRAIAIAERSNGPQHCSLSPILDAYADVLKRIHREAEAAKISARSRAIRGT
jgi:tetratricopeptide (TPR) repeat protein